MSRTPDGDETSRLSRRIYVILWGLIVAVMGLTTMIVVLTIARSNSTQQQQQQINDTFCQVLAQLPQDSPELALIRGQLGCKQPGLTPSQMKQLAKTGGTH